MIERVAKDKKQQVAPTWRLRIRGHAMGKRADSLKWQILGTPDNKKP